MGQININYSYPNDPDFEYSVEFEKVNLDEERVRSINSGRGFIIREPQSSLKKDLKSEYSIYSSKYGSTMQDPNPFDDGYRCQCGAIKGRYYLGVKCELCNKKVKYVDDDFGFFGWIVLKDPYYIIHPNLFNTIESLIGSKKLDNILYIEDEKDKNGKSKKRVIKDDEIYAGIGMQEFYRRFDEIIDYSYKKATNKKAKKEYYDNIKKHRNKIFIQSIPVYTTLLRAFSIVNGEQFKFEGTNGLYNMLAKIVSDINRDSLRIYRKKKNKNQSLYDAQMKLNQIYKEIEQILSGKKGTFRTLFGGRYNFTSRDVIVPNPKLRINEVTLPYIALLELLQQRIINVIQKTNNIGYNDAYGIWERSKYTRNQRVIDIINTFINKGIRILINRNPTICYGSILCMKVVGMTFDYTMGIPLQILPHLAADFDGDVLNVHLIINKEFELASIEVFDPANSMYISRNDGLFNNNSNHTKDLLINANSLVDITRKCYTTEQLEKIKRAQVS